jgi:putative chitinase
MIPVDGDFIRAVAPRFSGAPAVSQDRIIGAVSGDFAATLASYGIETALRIAHFMGQVTHECAGFRTTEEFASGAAYEGRRDLGNTQRGDGKRYKGRGLLQLTGRANYREYGTALDLPLEEQPELAADPLTSLRIACEYWQRRKINDLADVDDLPGVTRRVNGGLNGLDDRRKYLQKAKSVLAAIRGTIVAAEQGGIGTVLRRGSMGEAVGEVQRLLRTKGHSIAVDHQFGPATELAVVEFQRRNRLEADGIVARETWAALRA